MTDAQVVMTIAALLNTRSSVTLADLNEQLGKLPSEQAETLTCVQRLVERNQITMLMMDDAVFLHLTRLGWRHACKIFYDLLTERSESWRPQPA